MLREQCEVLFFVLFFIGDRIYLVDFLGIKYQNKVIDFDFSQSFIPR